MCIADTIYKVLVMVQCIICTSEPIKLTRSEIQAEKTPEVCVCVCLCVSVCVCVCVCVCVFMCLSSVSLAVSLPLSLFLDGHASCAGAGNFRKGARDPGSSRSRSGGLYWSSRSTVAA